MNQELEKLVQQYADLYPYQEKPKEQSQEILSPPSGAPPERSVNIPVEQLPPILNPVAKDLQLLPPASRSADVQKIKEQVQSRNQIAELFCGENIFRLVLCAVILICLVMYFRKK
jgi:hypothetical protein